MKLIYSTALWMGVAMSAAVGPATAPTVSVDSFASGAYHFIPLPAPDWAPYKPNAAAESILFVNTTRDGQIQLALEPKDTSIDKSNADILATTFVKKIKETHTKNKTVMVMEPTIERDERFLIVIHEKYKVGKATADELHVYKNVGPRLVEMTVNTVASDPDKVKTTHDQGESLLDGTKYGRKTAKK